MGQEQQPPPPPPPMGAAGGPMSPQGQSLAEWWKRAVAAIIDGIIVSIPSYIVTAIFSVGFSRQAANLTVDPVTGELVGGGGFMAGFFGGFIITLLIIFAIGIIYYVYFWGSARGQTVGKMAMKIRVVDEATGGSIGYGRAFLRWLIIAVAWGACYIPGILDALWPLWDAKRQSWHDKVAKSLVVDVA